MYPVTIRTAENANCFECRKAPNFLEVGGNGTCPLKELVEERSKLESHHCPTFVPLEPLRLKRERKIRERLAERDFEIDQEQLF